MKTLRVGELEIRWTVQNEAQVSQVSVVYLCGMDIDKIIYKTDALTGEVLEMGLVKDITFIKACHSILRRKGFMLKKTIHTGTGLFRKEVNRRFFTPEFLRGEDQNS